MSVCTTCGNDLDPDDVRAAEEECEDCRSAEPSEFKRPPPCPNCGRQLGRSFTKGDFVCLACNRTFEKGDPSIQITGAMDSLAQVGSMFRGKKR